MHQRVPLSLPRQIEDLTHQIARGRIFYDLWWQLQGTPLGGHLDGVNLYPDFFRFSRHAYLYAMIVQTMVAFDMRRDVIGFASIFQQIRRAGPLSADLVAAQAKVAGSQAIVKSMKTLRDDCFAHRSRMTTYDDVWTRAAIRPCDIHGVQQVSLDAANALRRHVGLDRTEFHPLPGEDAVKLLAALQARASA